MNVHLGFTGTQQGMVLPQEFRLELILGGINFDVVHHGMCIGADEQFHYVIRKLYPKVFIIGHPPKNETKMAKGLDCDLMALPFEYLKRNRHIVEQSSVIIGCPSTMKEITRSGTWSTLRLAKKLGKETITILPSGDINEY